MMHGYIRCSTEEQTRGATIEEQRRVIIGMAMAKGVNQYDLALYVDAGVSGSTVLRMRPEGFKLWEAAQPGDVVVVAKLDRMFRDAWDAQNVYRHWREKGVDLILFDMGLEPVTRGGVGKVFFALLAEFAELERGRIRERILEGKRNKAEKGGHVGGPPPYGWQVQGHGREATLVAHENEREILAEVRRMGDDIMPKQAIKRLTALGFRSRSGRVFNSAQVQRLLHSVYGESYLPYTKRTRKFVREIDPHSEAGAYAYR